MKHFDTIKRLIFVVCTLLAFSTSTIFAADANILLLENGDRVILNNDIELPCDNATDGGIIDGDQTGCANPTYDPSLIKSVSLPTGGSGTLEYLWIYTTDDPHGPSVIWTPIVGVNSPEYDPGPISVETTYRRCARRYGCTDYVAESNYATITLDCCDNVTDGGKIGYDQSICGTSIDVAPITNITLPSGGSGELQYIWLMSTSCSNYFEGNTDWTIVPGSNSPNLDPGVITQTTCYIRCVRRKGCLDYIGESNVVTVTLHPEPYIGITVNSDPKCTNSGKLTAAGSSGTLPYTYSWSNGATTAMISGLGAGTYSVTVTDANGCTASSSKSLTAASAPSVSVYPVDVSCSDATDGMATANASGGLAPYTYAFSSGSVVGNKASDLAAGTHSVTVTDANGCTASKSFSISKPTPVYISLVKNADPKCDNSGKITASASGGTAPYSYSWSSGQSTAMISGLSAGTYTVTATDDNGCTNVQSLTLYAADAPTVSVTATDISCNGYKDGSASATASGGTGSYSYAWSNGGNTATISGLAAGTYTVTVTDGNGCKATGSGTVYEPSAVTVSTTKKDETCGDSNGSATASGSGGTGAISYIWSNWDTNPTITGLAAGTYTVTATDANGCQAISTVTIKNQAGPSVSVEGSHLDCYGDNDGTAWANASGGTNPLSYEWSNGATTANISGLAAGTYTVTVTDANGCYASGSTTITQPSQVTVNASGYDATCGAQNGSASASASGGTPGYTYNWSNGDSGASISNLAPGVYTVTATDTKGCYATKNVNIGNIGGPTVTATGSVVKCNGDKTGTATAMASGGSGSLTYAWSNGGSTATITGLAAGTYTVTVTDENYCYDVASATVTEPSVLYVSASGTDETCGDENGTASASASGGTGPYTYAWSNGGSGTSISGLEEGAYTVTATDVNGCTATDEVTIINHGRPYVSVEGSHLDCFGDTDGTAWANASGGTNPLSYEWSNGATTANITGLAAGTYTVTVTDANGCYAIGSTTITQPSQVTVNASGYDATCGAQNGSASASASGGTPGYTYNWSNGDSGASISNLAPGVYTVTATDTKGCYATANVNIGNIGGPSVTATGSSVKCNGDKTGTATAMASGGSGSLTYAWSNGGSTATITGLAAGTYTVTVTDENYCYDVASATVTEPSVLYVSAYGTDETCGNDNGTASASAGGGTGPYTYAWSNGGSGASISGLAAGTYTVTATDANGCKATDNVTIKNHPGPSVSVEGSHLDCYGDSDGTAWANASGGTNPLSYEWSNGATTANITGLAAGTYTVTVTDANGCYAIGSTTITQPSQVTVNASGYDATCGAQNGSASASASGGTPGYTYNWSNGDSGASISNLAPGVYTVTATDTKGCYATTNVNIGNIGGPTVTATGSAVKCNGDKTGTVTASASGGSGSLTYAWSNGGSTATITGLAAGTYTVTVTDENYCYDVASAKVTEPSVLYVSAYGTDETCTDENGTASASASGGTAPYTYAWNGGGSGASISGLEEGTYTVTATDANGCTATDNVTIKNHRGPDVSVEGSHLDCFGDTDGTAWANATGGTNPLSYIWSNGATTANITGLAAGTYSVTVTDANGCYTTGSTTVTEPSQVKVSASGYDATCGDQNGSASASASGGTPGYTYNWSNGDSGASISNLAPGVYTVTATDTKGCYATANVNIGNIGGPTVTATGSAVKCNGDKTGTATAAASGGSGSLTYAWSNGGNTATITGLAVGTYTVTVTDENYCYDVASATVTEPSVLYVSAYGTDETCTDENGTASASASGGTAPYTYAWSNGGSGASISGLESGTYTVTATDANGCTATDNVTIKNHRGPSVSVEGSHLDCYNDTDGTAWANASGGTNPLSYLWSNGATTANITGLTAGTYSVTVTDANGCYTTGSTTVTEPSPVKVSASGYDATCDDQNGSASASASGGTPGYTYNWSNGASGATASNLAAGTYSVTATDANGCKATTTITVGNIDGPSVVISKKTNVTCYGADDGTATAVASGGTEPYSFSWSDGSNTATATGLAQGGYTVTVTDGNGCTATASVTITQPNQMDVQITLNSVPGCDDRGSLTANASGGTPAYTYLWSAGSTGASISGLGGGTYSVTVTDANGCYDAATITLYYSEPGDISINKIDILCNGDNTGKATATLSGGALPITWSFSGGTQSGNMTSGLSAGSYGVTATDALGCVSTTSFVITEPQLLIALTATESSGCDDESGKATVNPQGGKSPYSIEWSTGATTTMITNIAAGVYTVTVTDDNGCTATGSATVADDVNLVCSAKNVKPASCYGGNDGKATATATGGKAPYIYAWSNGANQATAANLTAGTYTFTITDANGCSCSKSVTIEQPTEVKCTAYVTSEVSGYNKSDGSAKVNVTGGTPGYTYLWSNSATSMTANNLNAGSYTVTVTDINGCKCESSVVLKNKSQLGDTVFEDLNGNGIQDVGEPGVKDVEVTLTNLADNSTTTVTTDMNGNYLFDGLDAGNYKVTFDRPAGFVFTQKDVGGQEDRDSDADPTTGMTDPISLGQGESNLDVDAGIVRSGINVGDYVWIDTNQNGIQDNNEDGIAGIKVTLTNTMTNATVVKTTDADGLYLFTNVEPGKYKITFSNIPSDYRFTDPNVGGDDERDSDASLDMGMTDEFMVMLGDPDDLSFDAGIHLKCDNVTDAGMIAADQKLCGSFIPELLTNVKYPTGGNGPLEYIWLKNESGTMSTPSFSDPNWQVIPNSFYPNYLPGIVTKTTFYVRCVRRKGCVSYAESNVVKVEICPLPVVEVTFEPENTCVGDQTSFVAKNVGAGATYAWEFEGASIAIANTREVTGVTYAASGNYAFTLTVTSAEGCSAEDSYNIWIGCDTPLDFNNLQAETTEANDVKLDWSLVTPTVDNEYFIEQSVDGVFFKTVGSVLGQEADAYDFLVEQPKLGTSYFRIKHIDRVGDYVMSNSVKVIIKQGAVKHMFAYPNPATDFVKLELFKPLDNDGMLYIIDGYGRTVKTVNVGADTQFIDVDLSDLTRGMYFIEVQYDGFKKYRQKLFKAER